MKHCFALFCAVSAALPGIVRAQTLSVTELAVIRSSESAPPSSSFGPQGDTLFLVATVTDINGNYLDDGVYALPAYTSGPASGGNYSTPIAAAPVDNGYHTWQGYAPVAYSNPWTMQFGDKAGLGAPVQTPAEVTGPMLPFASAITLSGDPSHPTFTWTHAQDSLLSGSVLAIYNGELEVFVGVVGTGAVTYTLPPASAGGYDLVPGTTYYFDFSAYALRPGDPSLCDSTCCGNSCIAATSDNFVTYVPPSETLPLLHIPEPTGADPNPTYLRFDVATAKKFYTYVASTSETGFAYQAFSGPNFAAVTLPAGQSGDFTVFYNANGTPGTRTVAPGDKVTFPSGGVSEFVVTGVTSAASGFITTLQFVDAGTFVGAQSALSFAYPIPVSGPAAASVMSKPN